MVRSRARSRTTAGVKSRCERSLTRAVASACGSSTLWRAAGAYVKAAPTCGSSLTSPPSPTSRLEPDGLASVHGRRARAADGEKRGYLPGCQRAHGELGGTRPPRSGRALLL